MSDDKLTPAMRQWRHFKDLHPDKILLFRMGDFYETFHDDAVAMSRLVGLTLTKRGKDPGAAPLAGIPHHQLDRYLEELKEKGQYVVVVDQLEDPAQAKGVVKRGITRIVTPATVVDDNVLPRRDNNFLASVALGRDELAVAFADLSTGEFVVAAPGIENLADEFERRLTAETLVARELMADARHPVAGLLSRGMGGSVTRRDAYQFDPREGEARLKSLFGIETLEAYALADRPAAVGAAGAILAYLEENQAASLLHLKPPRLTDDSGRLRLDRNTIRNLELASSPAGAKNSLLAVLDQTLTGPGGRLLRDRLMRPSIRLDEIRQRQAAAAELMADAEKRRQLRDALDRMADLERIMARIVTRRAGPRDLTALAAACRRLPLVAGVASSCSSGLLREAGDFDTLADVADMVEDAIDPGAGNNFRDGVIRDGYHAEVDELRDIGSGGKNWLKAYEDRERERSGIPSLKVGYNRIHGFFIEVTNTHRDKIPENYERRQTMVNAERYITGELKEHETKALGAADRLLELENELFVALREELAHATRRVQTAAEKTAELDVAAALAEAGAENGYVIPEVHGGLETDIVEGRHPVAEKTLPAGGFVDNDLAFVPDTQRILIITGPNMAGKSTYIRQIALIFIMAQMGAPVPAKSARIGIADRVFTRVGAADDLARGQSTFMVEMVETADILHNATERSLIVLDEVGRGTSTFDGVSLAWAITEYLHNVIKARTLFATHYHELAELGCGILDRARNFNVAIEEWNNDITFLHRIKPGACDRSYGIHVGKKAGIPPSVVDRAAEVLKGLEAQAIERDDDMIHRKVKSDKGALRAAAREVQLSLFSPPSRKDAMARQVAGELAAVDINRLSPIEAHALLGRLADKAKEI